MRFPPLIVLFLCLAAGGGPRPVAFHTQTMGTWATVTIVTADSAGVAGAAYHSLQTFHRVDSLMSNWTTTSEVARINREAGRQAVVVEPEVARVIERALRVEEDSGGAFDITVEPLVRAWGFLGGTPHVPSRAAIENARALTGLDQVTFDAATRTMRFARDKVHIDLGGIAKGYGSDAAAEVLRAGGVEDALVNLSGNMVAMGNAAGQEGWVVGIRDPRGERDYVARLRLVDQAVATSGDYEQFVVSGGTRYGHILDPRTGYPARGVSSVTVVSKLAVDCDAWATAFFVMGADSARALAASRDDLAVVIIEPAEAGGTIWVEEALRESFRLADGVNSPMRYF